MIVHLADNDYWTKCEFRLGAFWSTQTSRMTKIRAWMRSIRRRVACSPGQVVAGVSMSENRASSVRWRRDISRRIGRWRSRIGWRARRRIYRGPQNRPGCNARSDAAPTRSAVVIAIAAAASVDIHVPVRGDIGVAVRIRVHIPIRGAERPLPHHAGRHLRRHVRGPGPGCSRFHRVELNVRCLLCSLSKRTTSSAQRSRHRRMPEWPRP
jgi:hypothetical protein